MKYVDGYDNSSYDLLSLQLLHVCCCSIKPNEVNNNVASLRKPKSFEEHSLDLGNIFLNQENI